MSLYRNWEILEGAGAISDPKREGFLKGLFGEIEVMPSQFVAKRGETILPLFELGLSDTSLLRTARGFGSKQAKKLEGALDVASIMGICLWDNRWTLESEDGKVYSPVFLQERQRIASEQPDIVKIKIPVSFGKYHKDLIAFQAATVKGLKHQRKSPGKIYYHIPKDEYSLN